MESFQECDNLHNKYLGFLLLEYVRNDKAIMRYQEVISDFEYKQTEGFTPADIETARQKAIDSFSNEVKKLKEENDYIIREIANNRDEASKTSQVFGEV